MQPFLNAPEPALVAHTGKIPIVRADIDQKGRLSALYPVPKCGGYRKGRVAMSKLELTRRCDALFFLFNAFAPSRALPGAAPLAQTPDKVDQTERAEQVSKPRARLTGMPMRFNRDDASDDGNRSRSNRHLPPLGSAVASGGAHPSMRAVRQEHRASGFGAVAGLGEVAQTFCKQTSGATLKVPSVFKASRVAPLRPPAHINMFKKGEMT
jgi:hypothetical protein